MVKILGNNFELLIIFLCIDTTVSERQNLLCVGQYKSLILSKNMVDKDLKQKCTTWSLDLKQLAICY